MKLKKIETGIDGLVIIEPKIFRDDRGYFMETYNSKEFSQIGLNMSFVQDNESKSSKGVLRGLHFQTKHAQGKLVRVLNGEVFDVGVDLRRTSPTYGMWKGAILSAENKRMLFVPEGFAHGFLVLSDEAVFSYKCTNFYHPEYDGGIVWNDETLNIDWPTDKVNTVILSEKDKNLKTFKQMNISF